MQSKINHLYECEYAEEEKHDKDEITVLLNLPFRVKWNSIPQNRQENTGHTNLSNAKYQYVRGTTQEIYHIWIEFSVNSSQKEPKVIHPKYNANTPYKTRTKYAHSGQPGDIECISGVQEDIQSYDYIKSDLCYLQGDSNRVYNFQDELEDFLSARTDTRHLQGRRFLIG
jgi:hypothetical protein